MAVPVRLDLLATLDGQGARLSRAVAQGVSQRGQRLRDLARALPRVEALTGFLATEDGTNLLQGYKRAANILKAEEKKGWKAEGDRVLLDDFVLVAHAVLRTATTSLSFISRYLMPSAPTITRPA